MTISRYLALVVGTLLHLRRLFAGGGHGVRIHLPYSMIMSLEHSWSMVRGASAKDVRSGQRFLAAAWAFMCGMAYYSFFEQVHRYQIGLRDPAPISSGWVAVIKGIGLGLGIIALVLSLKPVPQNLD